ncbi:MAG: HIT domain-containing protein [Ignavibacteria bacterium]|nr:HIT domain-containing protein [Ignavibacteria bacterium]
MEHLWSPWRSQYIETFSDESRNKSDCFLCDAFLQPQHDARLLVVARREYCFVIMNRFPYNSGHIMVVPNRHTGELRLLSDDELLHLFRTVREAEDVLHKVFKPHGINVGLNLGSAAGAGVPQHLHVHLVPRWNGDVNFMPVLADVKVVSERLEDTYTKLTQGFAASALAMSA